MSGSGRVVVVTGAGQGLGRAHALALAAAGFRVVVNDVGERAHEVVREIGAAGGTAVASVGDVADWSVRPSSSSTPRSRRSASSTRWSTTPAWSETGCWSTCPKPSGTKSCRVDLKGHFAPLRHAAAYWRDRAKEGKPVAARVVNTSSGAGLMGSVGQSNYSAAKAGVAALTQVAAVELARYGITVNAIAPSARTAMTEAVFADTMRAPEAGFDAMAPENVSPLVVWLASEDSGDVTGRVFEIAGGAVSVADGWQHGEAVDAGRRWRPEELGPVVRDLLKRAPTPAPVYGA